jgi:hypothetical protein
MRELRALAEQSGRKPGEIPVSIFGVPADETLLRQYHELQIERAVLAVPSEGRNHVLPLLDRYATLMPKFA